MSGAPPGGTPENDSDETGVFGHMPKMKSNSSVKKRFKVTATGKLMRRRSNHNHILTKKNAKRRRRLRQGTEAPASHRKRLRQLLVT